MSRGLTDKLAWTEPDIDLAKVNSLAAQLAAADGPADDGLEWPGELWKLTRKSRRGALVPGGTIWRCGHSQAAPGSCFYAQLRRRDSSTCGFHPV